MLCRVEMPTNEQIFGRFYRYNVMHSPARNNMVLMPVLFLAAAFLLWSMNVTYLLILALLVLLVAYFVVQMYARPASVFRKKGGVALQTEVYIFTETGYSRSVRSEEGGLPDNANGRYDALVQAVETKQDFYLYHSPGRAYLVDKAYFTNGTPEELRAVLRKALGKAFKTRQ